MKVNISLGFYSFCCLAHQMEVGLDLHRLEEIKPMVSSELQSFFNVILTMQITVVVLDPTIKIAVF